MRKIILLLFIAMTISANAQLSLKLGIVKSSVNSINFKEELKNESEITPLFGGIYYRINPMSLFGLETGLQYQGYSEKLFGSSIKQKRHYLSVPLAINYKPSSLVSPGIGIQLSQLISSTYFDGIIDNKFDLSAFAKLNINFLQSIGAELGYNLGLIPFSHLRFTNSLGIENGESKLTNRYFYFALKYNI